MADASFSTVQADPTLDLSQADAGIQTFDRTFTALVWLFAILSVFTIFWISWVVFQQALPAIQQFGFGFLTSQDWDVGNLAFGALPYIYGTLITSAIALLLAVPIGLAVALITSENFLPMWVKAPIAFLVELIAAIPSVIIGLWGIFVFIPFFLPFMSGLNRAFSFIPLFGTEPVGPSLLVAGVILAIMILPTMAALSRDVLLAIPKELRTASMGLGATRWETIFRVLLPTGLSGILGAATLALGRALGETMAVTLVIGNSPTISPSLLDLGSTIPSVLANQFGEALDPLHIGSLMFLALILFVLTLAVNMAAVLMVRLLGRSTAGM